MRTLPFRLLCVLTSLGSALGPRTSAAQEETAGVTLSEALRRARSQSPSVLAALASVARSRAEVSYARGAYLPLVALEGSTSLAYEDRAVLQNDLSAEQRRGLPRRIEATSQLHAARATLDFAVLDLARRNSIVAAERNVEAEQGARDEIVRDALEGAARIYVASVAARELVADARLTLERRTSQHAAISALVKAGLRPAIDVVRAQIEVVAARYVVETREIESEAASAGLSLAVGRDPTEPLAPTGFDDTMLPAPLEPRDAAELAHEQAPTQRRATATRTAREAEHHAARAARYPTLGLLGSGNASYTDIRSGVGIEGSSYYGSGGAYLRWAALDPNVWRRAHVTRAALVEAERQLDATSLAVRADAVEAAFGVKRARAVLEQATQVLEAAQTARTAQNERYKGGVASLLELLDAESVEQNARRTRIEAVRDHRIARARLLAACGVIDRLAREE